MGCSAVPPSTSPLSASLTPHPTPPRPSCLAPSLFKPALCQLASWRHPVPLAHISHLLQLQGLSPSCCFFLQCPLWISPDRGQLADANNGAPGYWSGGYLGTSTALSLTGAFGPQAHPCPQLYWGCPYPRSPPQPLSPPPKGWASGGVGGQGVTNSTWRADSEQSSIYYQRPEPGEG